MLFFLLSLLTAQASDMPDTQGSLYSIKGEVGTQYCESSPDNFSWRSLPIFGYRKFGRALKKLEDGLESDGWKIDGRYDVPVEQSDPNFIKVWMRYQFVNHSVAESLTQIRTVDVLSTYLADGKQKFQGGFVLMTLDGIRCEE